MTKRAVVIATVQFVGLLILAAGVGSISYLHFWPGLVVLGAGTIVFGIAAERMPSSSPRAPGSRWFVPTSISPTEKP